MLCPMLRCSDHYNVYPVCQLPMEVLDKKEKALEEIGEARWPEPRNPGRRKRKPVFGQKIDSGQKSHVRPTKKQKHKKKKTKTPKNTRVQKKIEKIKKEIKEMKKKKSKKRNKNRDTKSRGRDGQNSRQ